MRLFFAFTFCIISFITKAQLETQNWYFGLNAGISFATIPPSALLNGAISTFEGSSTISDAQGNLLFYTDGMFVYNNLHQQMPNGFGLLGNPSSAQSGVIVPKPGSNTIFYVFTVDAEGGPNGFRYSTVDMSLDNGLGDVIASSKNTLLFAPSVEKVAAVSHANGLYYWVIAHGLHNNTYYAYLIDCSGINAPITSNVGQIEGNPGWGCLSASSDGTKLATAMCNKGFELLDFNNLTGQISNPILLLNPGGAYGISFSPNNQVLYACKIEGGQLYQWDISSNNAATIIASMQQIGLGQGSPGGYKGGAIQLGLDQKLYIPHFNQPFLSCINNPNVLGPGCNLQHNAVNLQGHNAQLGLPPFVQSFFIPETIITPSVSCDSVVFDFSPTNTTLDSILWDFGDPNSGSFNQSSILSPSHVFPGPGTYTINLIKYLDCIIDTTTYTLQLDSSITQSFNQISTCDSTFTWNGTTFSQSGNYSITLVNSNGCDSIANLQLQIHYQSPVSINAVACGNYLWNGQQLTTSGTYYFNGNSIHGCDSTCILNLIIYPNQTTSISANICEGSIYTYNGVNYSTAGNFFINLQSINGCDSLIELAVNILEKPPIPIVNFTIPVCENDTIQFDWNNIQGNFFWMNPSFVISDIPLVSLPVINAQEGVYNAWQVLNNCYSDTASFSIDLSESFFLEDLQFPNIITANGDQVNDELDINSLIKNCYPFNIVVLNRWGNIVYEGKESSPSFNGMTTDNKALEEGIYFYKLDLKGQIFHGFFHLLR
jgi:gliding motility-associated-like protein